MKMAMSSSIILILMICYFCGGAAAVRDNYVGHVCSTASSGINSTYNENLKLLLDDLAKSDTDRNGSFAAIVREAETYKIYGLVLCRGDLSMNDCHACVTQASTAVMNNYCPNRRGATIWRDYCELKYSDTDFLGKVDTDDSNSISITNGVEMYKERRRLAENMMDSLKVEAAQTMLFANGSSAYGDVHAIAQCTRDLSHDGCKECLGKAVSHLFESYGRYESARVLYGSCHVRRELFDFLKTHKDEPDS